MILELSVRVPEATTGALLWLLHYVDRQAEWKEWLLSGQLAATCLQDCMICLVVASAV